MLNKSASLKLFIPSTTNGEMGWASGKDCGSAQPWGGRASSSSSSRAKRNLNFEILCDDQLLIARDRIQEADISVVGWDSICRATRKTHKDTGDWDDTIRCPRGGTERKKINVNRILITLNTQMNWTSWRNIAYWKLSQQTHSTVRYLFPRCQPSLCVYIFDYYL